MPRAKISYGLLTSRNQGGGGAKKQGLVNHAYWSRTPFRIFSANTNNNVQKNCISFKAIASGISSNYDFLYFETPTPASNVSVGWYIEGQGLPDKVKITGSVTIIVQGESAPTVVEITITSTNTSFPGLTSLGEYTFYSPECIE